MKNVVKVIRFGNEKPRLYALPDDAAVKAGTIVAIEYVNGATATGVTVSDSYEVDGETEAMLIDLMHFTPPTLDNLKRVVSVYEEHKLVWEEDEDDAEADGDEPEADSDEPEDETDNG